MDLNNLGLSSLDLNNLDLNNYVNKEDGKFIFSQQQASDFAKNVAGDFNPIHDVGAKKFLVPGDLLFSLILQQSGLSQKMQFTFSGMVNENTKLHYINDSENNNTKPALTHWLTTISRPVCPRVTLAIIPYVKRPTPPTVQA